MNPLQRWSYLVHRLNLYTLRLSHGIDFLQSLQTERSAERKVIKIHKDSIVFISENVKNLRKPVYRTFFLREIQFHKNEIAERKEFIQEFSDELIENGQRYIDLKEHISTQKIRIFGEMENLLNQNPLLHTQVNTSVLHPPVEEAFLFVLDQTMI